MSLKPSSRFSAKGTKKVQAQKTASLTENDEIIIKQPWTLRREDLAVDIPDYNKECDESSGLKTSAISMETLLKSERRQWNKC